jgi:choline kinase
MKPSDIAVIIVAAGRGSRMQDLTSERPKALIPFAGRPLIEWQFAALEAHGLKDITIVGGYRSEQLAVYGYRMVINPEWETTNMVHSLFCAKDIFLSGRTVIVAYADIIYEQRVLASLSECESTVATVIDRSWYDLWKLRLENPLDDAETLRLSEHGNILEIGNRPQSLDEIEGQYIGLSRFSPDGAEEFEIVYRNITSIAPGKTPANCYFTDILQGMISTGTVLKAAFTDSGWLEFDSTADLSAYECNLANGKLGRFWSQNSVNIK